MTVFSIVSTVPESDMTVFVRRISDPESIEVPELVAESASVREEISAVCCESVPENKFTEVIIGPNVNVKIFTILARFATCPERVFIALRISVFVHPIELATIPESVLTALVRLTICPESVEILEFIDVTVPERAFCARELEK